MNLLAEFAQYWTTHLWSASLQVTLFIGFVYAISLCFKRLPARYRYILWLLALIRLAVPTSITSPLGIGQYPERFLARSIQRVFDQQFLPTSQPPITQTTFPDTRRETMEAGSAPFGNPATFSPIAGKTNDSVPLLCTIWLSGILILVLVIVVRILLFRRRIRIFRPVARPDLAEAVHQLKRRLDITRAVSLLEARDADNVQFPLVHGILKPTIIMPAGMCDSWTTEDLEPLLLHELTHIKRRDCLVNFAQIALQVLYFYHPVVWFANWIIRREREFACDDDVVRHSFGCPTAYARSMLRIAESAANRRRHQLLGIAMADSSSNLGNRIRRMMNRGYGVNQQPGLIYLGAVFLAGFFCVAVSAQGPERPAATAQGNRIETESATDAAQSAPNAPADSMLRQVKSLDRPTDSSEAASQQIRAEIPYDGDRLVLTSDRQIKEGKTLRAAGNVAIAFRDMVITSDEVLYDGETRRAFTRGQTRFSQGNATLICSRAEFDFDAQNSIFYDASGSFYDTSGRQFSFSAGRVFKNGDNKFQMDKGSAIYELPQPPNPRAEDEILPVDDGLDIKAARSQDETTVAASRKSRNSNSKEFFSKWLNEEVVYIISDEEKEAFLSTTADEEKDSFITQFWLRRDPTPGTVKNEFREEHYSRIAYANEHFVSSIPGWKTDRGRIYIMWGKPGRIESHPNGGVYNRQSHEGGGTVRTYPFEKWWYRHIDGMGNDVEIEFLDWSGSGEYRMAMGPDEKVK